MKNLRIGLYPLVRRGFNQKSILPFLVSIENDGARHDLTEYGGDVCDQSTRDYPNYPRFAGIDIRDPK